jgi:hypothetical protein
MKAILKKERAPGLHLEDAPMCISSIGMIGRKKLFRRLW